MTTIHALPVTRPVLHSKPLSKPRFGQDNGKKSSIGPTQTPPIQRSPNKSKLLHWVLTGILGAGLGGTATHNVMLHHKLDNQRAHASAQIQGLEQRLAQQNQSQHDLLSSLAKQVQQLNGRTTMDQLVDVVAKVTPSTVRVEGQYGLGSGVLIQDNRGRMFILTNSHVTEDNDIDGAYRIKLYNGSDYNNPVEFMATPVRLSQGDLAASNSSVHDLAILAIPPDVVLPPGVRPVEMRNVEADPLRVGEVTVAVGNPYGNRDTVTSGIISHVDRKFSLEPQNRFIQTDTPINPGNSGGGLFDMKGRLIGINTLGYRGADGLGGSIRIDVIKSVLERWGIPVHAPGEPQLDLSTIETPANDNPFSLNNNSPDTNIPKSQTSKEARKD